jgi:hypothetical protein
MDTTASSRSGRLSRHGSQELAPNSTIPLIDFSRTPSPSAHPRIRSAVQSEDEEEEDFGPASSIRPLVSLGHGARRGTLGSFWFGTWAGWQIYVACLVIWLTVWSLILVLMNRFILLSE